VLYLDFSVCNQVVIVCSVLMSSAAQNVDGSTMAELLSSFQTVIRDTVLQLEDAGAFQNRSELAPNLLEFLEEIIGGRLPITNGLLLYIS